MFPRRVGFLDRRDDLGDETRDPHREQDHHRHPVGQDPDPGALQPHQRLPLRPAAGHVRACALPALRALHPARLTLRYGGRGAARRPGLTSLPARRDDGLGYSTTQSALGQRGIPGGHAGQRGGCQPPGPHHPQRHLRHPARGRPAVPVAGAGARGRRLGARRALPLRPQRLRSTATSPAGSTRPPGSGRSSTRSPTGSTSSRPSSASALRDIIPWWFAVLLPLRDAFLWGLVPFLRTRGYSALPVHFLGKAATANLLYAFPLLLLGDGTGTLADAGQGVRLGLRDLGDRPVLVGRAALRLAGPHADGRPRPTGTGLDGG